MENDIQMTPQFLTVGQCAARYNISQRHFMRLVEQGVMPQPLKLGRVSRWSTRALEEYDFRNTAKQTPIFDPASLLRTKKRTRAGSGSRLRPQCPAPVGHFPLTDTSAQRKRVDTNGAVAPTAVKRHASKQK